MREANRYETEVVCEVCLCTFTMDFLQLARAYERGIILHASGRECLLARQRAEEERRHLRPTVAEAAADARRELRAHLRHIVRRTEIDLGLL